MISLQLFGGVSLSDETGPLVGPATQRRRLALLVVLAAAPQGSVSRDKLIAYFWPEEDRDRARHFLADSVFSLRKSLGKDTILSVGDDLALRREAIDCDLWQFHQALEDGDRTRAAAVYRGPFLDGFFAADAPEFERWVEEERSRLARRYAETLEGLAEEAAVGGNPASAVHWWRRLAAQDPLSSRVALRLMQALAAAGDRAAAIQHAQVHAALLREELGLPPDPDVEALAHRLATPPETPLRADPPAAPAPQESVEAPEHSPSPAPEPVPLSLPRPRRRLGLVPVLLLAGLVGSAAMWGTSRLREEGSAPSRGAGPRSATVAVLPFSFRGEPENAYLGEGLVTLLSTSLNGAGDLRAIDPFTLSSLKARSPEVEPISPEDAGVLAGSLGADLFVMGGVVQVGEKLHITASIYRTRGDPHAIQTVGVEGTDVFALVDELVRQLLVGQLGMPADRLARLAILTTPSLEALKAYLQGERRLLASRYPEAADAFRRAVRADPSFALAHYRLSMAAEWSFRFVEAKQAARRAVQHSGNLSERDQALVRAWHAFAVGDAQEAERLYNAVLAEHPNDVEAWSGLGEVRLHYNPSRGQPVEDALPAFRRVLRLAPSYGEARFHLLEHAALHSDGAGFDSLLSAVDPRSLQRLSWAAARAHAWGGAEAAATYSRRLQEAEEVAIGIAAARAAVHFRDLDAAESLTRLLTEPQRPDAWRAAAQILRAQLLLARGDQQAAEASLDAAEPIEEAWALEIRALGILLPGAPNGPERLYEVRDELERWKPGVSSPELVFFFAAHADVHAPLRLYLLAMLSARLGDGEAAERYVDELRSAGRTREAREFVQGLVRSHHAHEAALRGDSARALRLLEEGEHRAPLERIALSPFFARSPDRFLRAELLRSLGRPEEALRWYASLSEGPDLLYWAVAHERQSEVLAALGRGQEARHHAERSVAIRSTGRHWVVRSPASLESP